MKLEDLDSQLEKNHLSGFWRTRVPSHSSEAPYLWKWEALLDIASSDRLALKI